MPGVICVGALIGTFDWDTFPDFIVGNIAYDQSMPALANTYGVTMVDATDTIHAFHQTGPDGNKAGHKRSKAPKDHNWRLWTKYAPSSVVAHHCQSLWASPWQTRGYDAIPLKLSPC